MNASKKYGGLVARINGLDYSEWDRDSIRREFGSGCNIEEAFALIKEAIERVLGFITFDVQLIGGMALFDGYVAEMATGEGKTLTAVYPCALHAARGSKVHVLTFNDYLAHRDFLWMGPVCEFLGLSCGYIVEGMAREDRKRQYEKDIVYLTAREAGFDYLRDFLALRREDQVQGHLAIALVDEADSILVDEARIPLVIAGKKAGTAVDHGHLSKLVRGLKQGMDFEIDDNGNRQPAWQNNN